MKKLNQAPAKHGNSLNSILKVVNTASSDLVLKSMLDDVMGIAQRRAKLVERMKHALLADDMIALKNAAEIICGLREENEP